MRRDFQVLIARPGRCPEATATLVQWLKDLAGTTGYLGGTVLRESAGELLPDTIALMMDFETIEDGRAFYQATKDKVTPVSPDDPGAGSKDQGSVIFAAIEHSGAGGEHHHHEPSAELRFDRGRGLFARMFHGHWEVVEEIRPKRSDAAARSA